MSDQTYSERWAEIVRLAKLYHQTERKELPMSHWFAAKDVQERIDAGKFVRFTAQQEADRREALWAEHFHPFTDKPYKEETA